MVKKEPHTSSCERLRRKKTRNEDKHKENDFIVQRGGEKVNGNNANCGEKAVG